MTAQTVSNAVATRDAGPIKFMWSKRSHLATVLPKSVDVEAFLGTAAGALYASDVPGKNLTLMKCAQANPDSLYVALMECASLGHMPGTDEYYLTPRMDHGRPKVLGIEGYKGVVERMYRSGAVAKVIAREVCAKDFFRYEEGVDERPVHKFGARAGVTGADFFGDSGSTDRGMMVGAYAVAQFTTGYWSRPALLGRSDVFAARDSGGYKPDDSYSPWNRLDGGKDHPEFTGRSMWWKTAAKRLEPWVPTSAEYRREQLRASAAAVEAAAPRAMGELPAPPGVSMSTGEVVDAEIVDDPEPQGQPAPQLEQPAERRRRDPGPSRAAVVDPGGEELPPPPDAPYGQQPQAPARAAQPDGDPRAAILAQFDTLGIAGNDQASYLTRLIGKPVTSVDGLKLTQAQWFAVRLAGIGSRDELEAAAVAAEARRDRDGLPGAE